MKFVLTVLLSACSFTSSTDGPFRSVGFDDALAAAKAEEKVVMIDFFTTWCGPCKKLDETTWKDEAVLDWLGEHTVALKLDAEIEVDLAARYKVDAYPTIVFIRPDGSVLNRLVGYRTAEVFIEEASDSLIGRTAVDRARESIVGHETDPMFRHQLGSQLLIAGFYEEALLEFLWCFDHGLVTSPAYGGVRLSFLLSSIDQLGENYPPAKQALENRLESAHKSLLEKDGTLTTVQELLALARTLGETGSMLKVHDALIAQGDRPEAISRIMSTFALLLVMERRYEEVVRGMPDLKEWLELQSMILNRSEGADGEQKEVDPPKLSQVMSEAASFYEALIAVGELEGVAQPSADEFEEALLLLDSSSRNYARMIKRAIRAERLDRARNLLKRAEQSFTGKMDLRRIARAAKNLPASSSAK